jgi:hypothetical protein
LCRWLGFNKAASISMEIYKGVRKTALVLWTLADAYRQDLASSAISKCAIPYYSSTGSRTRKLFLSALLAVKTAGRFVGSQMVADTADAVVIVSFPLVCGWNTVHRQPR